VKERRILAHVERVYQYHAASSYAPAASSRSRQHQHPLHIREAEPALGCKVGEHTVASVSFLAAPVGQVVAVTASEVEPSWWRVEFRHAAMAGDAPHDKGQRNHQGRPTNVGLVAVMQIAISTSSFSPIPRVMA
jgi:hypothetical protein